MTTNTCSHAPRCAFNSVAFHSPRLGLLSGASLVLVTSILVANAAVELKPGMAVEFATVEQGREILAERETGFLQAMSPFDRCLRMKTSRSVSEDEFVTYITSQVRAWSAAEKTKVTGVLNWFATQTRELNLSFPSQFYLVKTTGNEEGNAAYLRGSAVVLPQVALNANTEQLQKYLAHELFHVYMHHNPQFREALYRVIGFRLCPPVTMPDWLRERRITDPNPGPRDFYVLVNMEGAWTPCMPVFYSRSTDYTSGQIFDYLVTQLLVLESAEGGYRASCLPDGEPRLLDPTGLDVVDYNDQIGWNTTYIIHPEEILAENFVWIVEKSAPTDSPRVPYLLRKVINNPIQGLLLPPAGRFSSRLEASQEGRCLIEYSTNMAVWNPWEYATNTASGLEVIDPEAWLNSRRFFRARWSDLPVLRPGDTNQMVWIAPGSFLLGSPANELGHFRHEGPQTRVTLTHGFWMGKYEVTQAEYEAVMGTNPSLDPGLPLTPVNRVSWDGAMAYCTRLNELERNAGRLTQGWAYRLPTEAEWEYAARAGTTNRFSFGDDPEGIEVYRYAIFMDNRIRTHPPRPVSCKPPNPWGLYGIHGNVAEWCADWYGEYPGGSVTDPTGPSSGTERVIRSGGYSSRYAASRSAHRFKAPPPTDFRPDTGFRIVLAPADGD